MRAAPAPPREQIEGVLALYSQGRLQEALAQAEALAGRYPAAVILHNILGAVNAGLGRPDRAAANFTEALRVRSGDADTHNNLGIALKDLGKYDEAIASFAEALRIRPGFAEAHNNLGIALSHLGTHDAAVYSFTEALRINPDFAEAHSNLGNTLRALGRHDEAIASYTRALRIKPEYALAHNNLGLALKDLGKHDEAIASFAEALRINPGFAEAHTNMGIALSALDKREAAIVSFNKSLRINPDSAKTHAGLGNALKAVGRHDEAIASFNEVLRIAPGDALAKANLASIMVFLSREQHSLGQLQMIKSMQREQSPAIGQMLSLAGYLVFHGDAAAPELLDRLEDRMAHGHGRAIVQGLRKQFRFIQDHCDPAPLLADTALVERMYSLGGYHLFKGDRFPERLIVVFVTKFNNFHISNLAMYALLRPLGCSILFLKDNTYFNYLNGVTGLGNSFAGLAGGIRRLVRAEKFERVYFTGYSSGGFAALLASTMVPCSGYVGFSHPTDLSPDSPFNPGKFFTADIRKRIDPAYLIDLKPVLNHPSKEVPRALYYGDRSADDTGHAEHLRGVPGLELCRIEGCGHSSVAALMEAGIFHRIFSDLLYD